MREAEVARRKKSLTALAVILVTLIGHLAFAQSGACIPGAEEEVTAIDRLSVTASWNGFSGTSQSNSATWNPLPGWVVLDHEVIVNSSSNGNRSVSILAADLNFASESQIDWAYDYAADAAYQSNDESYEAEINEQYEEHRYNYQTYKTNKNTIHATVSASTHGTSIDRKRGWEDITVRAKIRCLGEPHAFRLAQQVAQKNGLPLGRRILIENACYEPTSLYIQYLALTGEWEEAGWYEFDSQEEATIAIDGRTIQTQNAAIGFYAETESFTWDGDHNMYIGDTEYMGRVIEMNEEDELTYRLVVNCG